MKTLLQCGVLSPWKPNICDSKSTHWWLTDIFHIRSKLSFFGEIKTIKKKRKPTHIKLWYIVHVGGSNYYAKDTSSCYYSVSFFSIKDM